MHNCVFPARNMDLFGFLKTGQKQRWEKEEK